MAIKKNIKLTILIFLSIFYNSIYGLSNLTQNDPFPYFTTMYPYDYLSLHERVVFEKIGTTCFDEERWSFSVTPFFQWADNAINANKDLSYVGDIPERVNVLALFFDDPFLRNPLQQILGIEDNPLTETCLTPQTNPANSDPTKKFGFFSMPIRYRKSGFRFQLDLKIWERCFDAVGLRAQFGVANIRQNTNGFLNQTCTALGITCPAVNNPVKEATDFIKQTANCENPREEIVIGSGNSATSTSGTPQPWRLPCNDTTCCIFAPNCQCKEFIIVNIMNQFEKIAQFIGVDIRDFDNTEPEDLRILLWWRHIKEINSINPTWPRVLWIPFLEVGAGIPLTGHVDPDRLFALPFGNNGHASAGAKFGFALDFIDILELSTEGGFTKFFKQEICGLRLPTNAKESRLYPYKADAIVEPGNNFHFSLTLNARHFLDRLSVWAQYLYVNHSSDCVKICRSFIPEGSIYYPTNPVNLTKISPDLNNTVSLSTTATPANLNRGFALKKYEELTYWEINMFNLAFNYDISPNVYLGLLWQHTFNRRNAYCTDTLMFSVTATF